MDRRRLPPRALAVAAALALAGASAAVVAAGPAPEPSETGPIHSVAGAGFLVRDGVAVAPSLGDRGPAGLARLDHPVGVAALPDGGYLIADQYDQRIRRVGPRGGIVTVAGSGRAGFSGDGGPAGSARLDHPTGVALLAGGQIAIADQRNDRVRLVAPDGTISTLAQVPWPQAVAAAADGGVLVADRLRNRILHVGLDGTVTNAAGTGVRGFSGDGGPAGAAQLNRPADVAPAADGGFLIADGSGRIRRVAADGTITTVAGNGSDRSSGDGGPATDAGLPRPSGVAETPDGGLVISTLNLIRRVRPDGVIVTVAGTGRGNFSGDGGPARRATLWLPDDVAVAAGGGILLAAARARRIRYVDSAVPGAGADPAPARPLAISFRRPIQRGESAIVTHLRACGVPRRATVRFSVNRRARVVLSVRLRGRVVARRRAVIGAGVHRWPIRVARPGEHLLVLNARDRGRRVAAERALLSVRAACRR